MKQSTRLLLVVVVVVCTTAAIQAWLVSRRLESVVIPNEMAAIRSHASLLAAEFQGAVVGVGEDVVAISSSPTVQAFVDAAMNRSPDGDGDGEVAKRKQQVELAFIALLKAKPDYCQARIISKNDGGQERVRVDRSRAGDSVKAIPDPDLQSKGARDYFLRGLNAAKGDVVFSPLDLNREHGQVQSPNLPVLRASAPLHDSAGELYGVLVVNVDMGPALARARAANTDDRLVLVVSEKGDYLAHPKKEFEFGADLGTPYRLHLDFPPVALMMQTEAVESPVDTWAEDSAGAKHYVSLRRIGLDNGVLAYMVEAVPRSVLMSPATAVRWMSIVAAVFASLLGAFLAIAVTRSVTRRLEQMTHAVQAFPEKGTIELPIGAEGEIGILADAFRGMAEKVADTTESLRQEVRERQRAEDDARHLAAIVTSSGDAIFATTKDGVITSWNRGAERLLQYSEEEIKGQHVALLTPTNFRKEFSQILEAIKSGASIEYLESQLLCRDDSLVDVSVSVWPIEDAEGQLVGVSYSMRDFTKQKLAEEERDRYEERFRNTVEAAPTAIVMTNAEGKIELVNAATEELFGYGRSELVGQPIEVLVPEPFRQDHAALRLAFLAAPVARQMGAGRDLYGLRKDGSEVPVEIGLSPVHMNDGIYILSTIADITERKLAEQQLHRLNESLEARVNERTAALSAALDELTAAKEEAECANQAKSSFLANMSHEIRTPMASVTSAAELLLQTQLSAKQREYTNIIRESSVSLLDVINDILDFSRIEAQQLTLECVSFDHAELLASTMKSLAVRAHAKGIELGFSIDPTAPDELAGDPGRLRQALVNLVGNAIKFTEKGEVWLNARLTETAGERVLIHYAVSDTGVGVPKQKQAVITKAFEQGDASHARRFGGTGLGLSITSSLAELMGGRLWFESTEGFGSTFHFTAWFVAQSQAPAQDRHAPLGARGQSALVVAKNAKLSHQLKQMLQAGGMIPLAAKSVSEAVQRIEDGGVKESNIRVVILDAHAYRDRSDRMVAELRRNGFAKGAALILLTDANQSGEAAEELRREGAMVLTKPVGQRAFRQALQEIFTTAATADQDRHAPPIGYNAGGLDILLAEDNSTSQALIKDMLAGSLHRVRVASNGREAVQLWQSERPDLVLMDVQMPSVDGLEATRAIRQQEKGSGCHTPIVAITAHAMKGDRERCLAAGMDAYLAKPFHIDDLIDVLKSTAHGEGLGTLIGSVEKKREKQVDVQPAPVVNWSTSLQAAKNDPEVLRRLAEIAVRETDDLLKNLQSSIAARNPQGVRRCAASLRNHYKLFGAAVADHVAFHIENTAADGNADVESAYRKLCQENSRLQSELIGMIEGRFDPPQSEGEIQMP